MRNIPYQHGADKAFQQYLNQKFNTTTPMPRVVPKNSAPITKKDFIASIDGEYPVDKQTQTTTLRKLFSKLINNASSLTNAKKMLADQKYVKNVRWVETKKYKYFKVETIFDKNINCRGKEFEELEKLYYSPEELAIRIKNKVYKEKLKTGELPAEPIKSIKENRVIWKKHQDWWIEQLKQRIPSKKIIERRQSKLKKIVKKFEDYYEKHSKQQRIYFIIYKNNISEELIDGYKIWEKYNTKYLVNLNKDIKIYDQPDQITLSFDNNDLEKRKEAIRLALAIALSKGWNLDDIEATGSPEFVREVKQQINQLKAKKEVPIMLNELKLNFSPFPDIKEEPLKQDSKTKTPKFSQPKNDKIKRLNSISQKTDDLNEKQQRQLSKEIILKIKQELNPQTVIQYAKIHYKLLDKNFEITNENKINDKRTKAKPKTTIDFLTKVCNIPFQDALAILDDLYQKQLDINILPTIIEPTKTKDAGSNIVKQDITRGKQKNEIVNNLIKNISPKNVVSHICFENNLNNDFFIIKKDNQIIDTRTNTIHKNILEFIKVFENMTNKESVTFLYEFLLEQQKSQKIAKNTGKEKVAEANTSKENSSVSKKQSITKQKISSTNNLKDFEKIINEAVVDAKSRREFVSNLKNITKTKNVSFKKDIVKIGDKELKLGFDIKLTEEEILQIFKFNSTPPKYD